MVRLLRASLCLLFVATGVASLPVKGLSMARSFVRSLEFRQEVRICNAYPFGQALDVYVGKQRHRHELPRRHCSRTRSSWESWRRAAAPRTRSTSCA